MCSYRYRLGRFMCIWGVLVCVCVCESLCTCVCDLECVPIVIDWVGSCVYGVYLFVYVYVRVCVRVFVI